MFVPAADATLYVRDEPGNGPAIVLVNGGFATTRHWKFVLRQLGNRYRTVRFDARGRGRSTRSADYSTASAVADVGRVIQATGVRRPILVGWSHGATLAVRYAIEHPEEVAGLVLVDGAFPIAMFDEAARVKARALFHRLAWLMRIMALLGLSGRMSADEAADLVIDMDRVNGELDFGRLRCPTTFVVGTGAHAGATEEEVIRMRAAAGKAVESNPLVSVFATVPANHAEMVSKAADTVAAAVDLIAGTPRSRSTAATNSR